MPENTQLNITEEVDTLYTPSTKATGNTQAPIRGASMEPPSSTGSRTMRNTSRATPGCKLTPLQRNIKQTKLELAQINSIIKQTTDSQDIDVLAYHKQHLIRQLTDRLRTAHSLPARHETDTTHNTTPEHQPEPDTTPTDTAPPTPEIPTTPNHTEPALDSHLNIQLANPDNSQLKDTHHHYCGFYANKILPSLTETIVINSKTYTLAPEPIINYSYSGNDTIITEQRYIETTDTIPTGTPVFNAHAQIVCLITGKQNNKYPLQDSYNRTSLTLSNIRATHKTKTKIIAYADQQFSSKKQLVNYLKTPHPATPKPKAIIYTDPKNNQTQLIIHQHGRNITNLHLKHHLIDRYQTTTAILTKQLETALTTGIWTRITANTKTQKAILADLIEQHPKNQIIRAQLPNSATRP